MYVCVYVGMCVYEMYMCTCTSINSPITDSNIVGMRRQVQLPSCHLITQCGSSKSGFLEAALPPHDTAIHTNMTLNNSQFQEEACSWPKLIPVPPKATQTAAATVVTTC